MCKNRHTYDHIWSYISIFSFKKYSGHSFKKFGFHEPTIKNPKPN